MRALLLSLLCAPLLTLAQPRQITLEDLYKKGTFRGEFINARFDTSSKEPSFQWSRYKDQTGKSITRPDDVVASPGKPGLWLVKTKTEPIYRRSSKSVIHLLQAVNNDTQLIKLTGPLGKGAEQTDSKFIHASFSPTGEYVSYVFDNNLYLYQVATGQYKSVTTDGKWNFIINGNCDWVYEEEFEFSQAYAWNKEGTHLAYYRFDESKVKEFNMTFYDNAHNSDYRYKYPKAGDDNSSVEIYVYDINTGSKVKAETETGDIYIPRIKWTQDNNTLIVFWMNRHQNHLKLLATDATTDKSRMVYEEKNKYFVEINDDWWFLQDGKHFLFTSEMNGYRHLYLYSFDGAVKTQVTQGNQEITEINGVDEKNKRIYYTVAAPRPMDRNIMVTDFSGKSTTALTASQGWNRAVFNDNFTEFFLYYSTINTPQQVSRYQLVTDKKKGTTTRLLTQLGTNNKLQEKMTENGFGQADFIRIPNSKGDTLNGWMLKPAGFDATKKYPVLFCNYGGPGSQQVANRFGAVST